MKHILINLTIAATLFPTGCHNDQPRPREIIILPDISASIDKESQQQMFATIRDAALRLHRGDSLTIIPIMGDAEAELQGQILHYEVAPIERREAYDGDIRSLDTQIATDLSRLTTEAASHPGIRTDILGSVRVALRTFSTSPTDKHLIIISDFIQDDDQFRFATDRRLESEDLATALACNLVKEITVPMSIQVVMGRLKSSEFDQLPVKRKFAINTFWNHLLFPSSIAPDGFFVLHSSMN